MKNGKKITVFRFSALGDVAMCFPVMGRVLMDNPQLSIIFVTKFELALLAENVPGLSVSPVDIENHYRGIGAMIKLFREIEATISKGCCSRFAQCAKKQDPCCLVSLKWNQSGCD